jgi:Carboxypeptidase regulatory-like domain
MAKLKFCSAVLLFLISLSSEFLSQTQIKDQKTGTATVSGQVKTSSESLRRVTVTLQDKNDFRASPKRVKTDNDGRFQITGIPAGTYMLNVIAPNYIVPNDGQNSMLQGRTLNVADGEKIENIDIELVRGGVISGKVTDSKGRPVIETFVSIVPADRQAQQIALMKQAIYLNYLTDDRGIYRVFGLAAGLYLISVGGSARRMSANTSSNVYFPQTFHPDVTERSKAKLIELSEGGEVVDVDITVGELKRAYEVAGRVVDSETGAPAPNLSITYGAVSATGQDIMGWASGSQRSNSLGEFVLSGLIPGTYRIYVAPDDTSGFYSDPITIEVSGENVAGVAIKVKRGGVISGVVILEGVRDPVVLSKLASIQLHVYSRMPGIGVPPGVTTWVKPDGSFVINGLPPGKVGFSLYAQKELRGTTIERIEKDGLRLPHEFDFAPGQQITNLRVVANYGTGAVSGKLSVIGETLPRGYYFSVSALRVGMEGSAYFGTTADVDARGQFVIERLPPGEYRLSLAIRPFQSPVPTSGGMPAVNRAIYQAVGQARQQVSVTNGAVAQVSMVLDLSRKEDNK